MTNVQIGCLFIMAWSFHKYGWTTFLVAGALLILLEVTIFVWDYMNGR